MIDSEEGSQIPVRGVAQEPRGRGGAELAAVLALRAADPKEENAHLSHPGC